MGAADGEAQTVAGERDVELDLADARDAAPAHRLELQVRRARLVADHDEIGNAPSVEVGGVTVVLPRDPRRGHRVAHRWIRVVVRTGDPVPAIERECSCGAEGCVAADAEHVHMHGQAALVRVGPAASTMRPTATSVLASEARRRARSRHGVPASRVGDQCRDLLADPLRAVGVVDEQRRAGRGAARRCGADGHRRVDTGPRSSDGRAPSTPARDDPPARITTGGRSDRFASPCRRRRPTA